MPKKKTDKPRVIKKTEGEVTCGKMLKDRAVGDLPANKPAADNPQADRSRSVDSPSRGTDS